MSDLGLYIAASALDAQQVGQDTVAQDLANVDTPYYARETVNMAAVPGSSDLSAGGVTVTSVSQVTNSITTAAALTADGLLSQQQATNQVLTQAQALFPEPNGDGIQSQLSAFWSAWDEVGNEPSNAGARQAAVADAQQLATSLNEASSGLTTLQNQTLSNLDTTISQANTMLSQVSTLNQQIVIAQAGGGDANSLIDQQTELLDQLSQSLGITYNTNSNGAATVYLGGVELVQGNVTLPTPPPVLQVTPPVPAAPATLTSAAAVPASTTVTTGTSDTIDVTVDGTAYTLTLPPSPAGGYTPTGLVAAVNTAIQNAGATNVLNAGLNSAGELELTASNTATGSSLAVTGGDGVATVGLAVASSTTSYTPAQIVYEASPGVPSSDLPLGGTAAGLLSSLSTIASYQGDLDQTAFALANTVNNQQASGYYWADAAGSAPSADGTTAYQGNADTSGNPLSIFDNTSTGSVGNITAATIGVDSEVAANPFYMAASNQSALASTQSSVTMPASTSITTGTNDTIDVTVNGTGYALVLANGAYNPAQLVNEINTVATGAGAPLVASETPEGYLVLTASTGSLQLTNGDALGSLGLAVMSNAATPGAQQNNGQNAQAMAEQSNAVSGTDTIYQNLISQVGTDVATSTSNMNAQQSTTTAADQAWQSLSGVSSDEETVAMQMYQNAYEAASKVVTTAETMFESLLDAV